MERKVISFDTEQEWLQLRKQNVNSTEVSAILGLSPYMTLSELWHLKKNNIEQAFQETERMTLGKRLEQPIMEHFAEIKGWSVEPYKKYGLIPELRLGSSFDAIILEQKALLEIKNVDYFIHKQQWDQDEATPYIELQVQTQMLVSGLDKLYIAALVGGNDLKIIERDADPETQDAIVEGVRKFWNSINNDTPPEFDFVKDSDFIKRLYDKVDGTVIESEDLYSLAVRYKDFAIMEAEAKEQKEAVKSEILTMIKSAEKVKGSRYSISAGIVNKEPYMVKAQSYRNFRVTLRGDK